MAELPRRTNKGGIVVKNEYSYDELIQSNIPLDSVAYITISQSDLKNDFDLLRKIVSENKKILADLG